MTRGNGFILLGRIRHTTVSFAGSWGMFWEEGLLDDNSHHRLLLQTDEGKANFRKFTFRCYQEVLSHN